MIGAIAALPLRIAWVAIWRVVVERLRGGTLSKQERAERFS